MDAEFPDSVDLCEGATFEAQPESPMIRQAELISAQHEAAARYRHLCESALDVKIGGYLNGIDLLILAGHIMADELFKERTRGYALADSCVIPPGSDQLVADSLTREEKLELRTRLQKKGALPKA